MKSITFGTKSANDWIGEELLMHEATDGFKFAYSVIAQHKVQTYCLEK